MLVTRTFSVRENKNGEAIECSSCPLFMFCIKYVNIQTGEITKENRYFIISFENNIHDFSDAVRKHWGVENNLHAPLDIIFLEDKNKTLEKNGAKNLGIFRRIVLNILKFIQCYYNKMSLNLIRFDISMDVETGLEKVFKILNTEQIKSLLKENA